MPDTPRLTRRYASPFPRYSTAYARPSYWWLARPIDIAIVTVLVVWTSMPLWGLWFVLAGIFIVGRMVVHCHRTRDEVCAQHGHDPYRPIPEVPEYRCHRCLEWLPDDEGVMGELARRLDDLPDLRKPPQARWSDRR